MLFTILVTLSMFITSDVLQCSAQVQYITRHIKPLFQPEDPNLHIKIAVLLPNDTLSQCSLMKVLPAIDVAIDSVRKDRHLFGNAKFSITYSNGESDLSVGPLRAIDIFNANLATVMLGPVTSFTVANVVRYSSYRYKVPILSAEAFASDLGDKRIFKLLTRLSGTYKDMGTVFNRIFHQFKWTPRNHNTVAIWYIWHKITDYECNFQTKPIMDRFKQTSLKYIDVSDELHVLGIDGLKERIIHNLIRISKNARSEKLYSVFAVLILFDNLFTTTTFSSGLV